MNTSAIQEGLSGAVKDLIYYFTNGRLSPKVKLTTNVFHRFRFINSLSNWFLQFALPHEYCEWHLIATDGVFMKGDLMNYALSNASHNNHYIMSPGGRADILVKCTEAGSYEVQTTESSSQDPQVANFYILAYGNRTLFTLEVSDGAIPDGSDNLPVDEMYPDKPVGSYIEDLSGFDASDVVSNCTCNKDNYPPDNECSVTFYVDVVDAKPLFLLNNRLFDFNASKSVLAPQRHHSFTLIAKNKAHEFIIDNKGGSHVYHQHINPFQVTENIGKNGYLALKNTWWDTISNKDAAQNITMRFWSRDYDGLIIVHCHLLQHEDQGMMGFYGILPEGLEPNPLVHSTCPNRDLLDTVGVDVNETTQIPMDTTIILEATDFYTSFDESPAVMIGNVSFSFIFLNVFLYIVWM